MTQGPGAGVAEASVELRFFVWRFDSDSIVRQRPIITCKLLRFIFANRMRGLEGFRGEEGLDIV
jgi:hypothetical protein